MPSEPTTSVFEQPAPKRPDDRCHCGHDRALHDPCSRCECPWFRPAGRVKAKRYPARPTEEG